VLFHSLPASAGSLAETKIRCFCRAADLCDARAVPEIAPFLPALDRAAHLRRDGRFLEARLSDPESLLIPFWRNKLLVSSGGTPHPVALRVARAPEFTAEDLEIVWLGLLGERACFAVDISAFDQPLAKLEEAQASFEDLRIAGSLMHASDFGTLAFARGILHWHRQHRFCGRCAAPTRVREGGHVRECEPCDIKHFPRTDPAVMILVTRGDRCLLARQPQFPGGMFSALAGFVEPGESVEECVLREAREEVGLEVSELRYFRSQSWPFPQSLMIGFNVTAERDDFVLDREELEEARWFSRAELREPQGFFYPPRVSLAHHMIQAFVERG
jgi:NAD+ diphosphatase